MEAWAQRQRHRRYPFYHLLCRIPRLIFCHSVGSSRKEIGLRQGVSGSVINLDVLIIYILFLLQQSVAARHILVRWLLHRAPLYPAIAAQLAAAALRARCNH